jgi:hypothetical protein
LIMASDSVYAVGPLGLRLIGDAKIVRVRLGLTEREFCAFVDYPGNHQ